uniref:MAGE domain-containing protein n=1 Tax=Oryctolagus cuniculus TaxID=9986 RepID=G1TC54_RABIT
MRTSCFLREMATGCARSQGIPENIWKRFRSEAMPADHRTDTAQKVPRVKETIPPAGQKPCEVFIPDSKRRLVCESPSLNCCPKSYQLPSTQVIIHQASQKISKKSKIFKLEEALHSQCKVQGLVNARDLEAKKEAATSFFPSCSTSSASCSYLTSSNTKGVSVAGGQISCHGPHRASCSATSVVTPSVELDQGSSSQEEKNPCTLKILPDAESLIRDTIDDKVADLVQLLLLKYRMKEPVTKAEMQNCIIKIYENYFPVIFNKVYECMQLVFGIDIKKVDSSGQSYVLVPSLGLTYDGMLGDILSMPKVGLLINILGVIFLDGNCAPEEDVWEVLNAMGVYDGKEHFIYGEPRKLLTEDWVREGYLECRQVPHSDPARYEYLWGPRAHAETTKMKILEFLAKINDTVPSALPIWYEEALRDEEARAKVKVRATEWAEANSRAMFSCFFPK